MELCKLFRNSLHKNCPIVSKFCHLSTNNSSYKLSMIMLLLMAVDNVTSAQNIADNGMLPNSSQSVSRQCQSDQWCANLIDAGSSPSSAVCVDSFCYCSANHKTIFEDAIITNNNDTVPDDDDRNNTTESSHRLTMRCVEFRCRDNIECQQYDQDRVCDLRTGQCLCKRHFLEKSTNGKKCTQKYATLPVYEKIARKYLNKNRISYRENVEYLDTMENPKMQWIQYVTFLAFFVSQIILIVNYVISKRRRIVKKLLLENELLRRNNVARNDGQLIDI